MDVTFYSHTNFRYSSYNEFENKTIIINIVDLDHIIISIIHVHWQRARKHLNSSMVCHAPCLQMV